MLVVTFQVQVGLGAAGVAGAGMAVLEHGGVGGAGIEPDFQDVAALGVVHGVGADDGLGSGLAPGFDAALFHDVGRLVQDLQRTRVQLATVLVDEQRQRHAPAALAADAPVGPAGDHVAQAGLAVFRVEAGVFDGSERHLAQRGRCLVGGENPFAFVHADEPLRGGAVDHRALVAPAMRVAVADGLTRHQALVLAQGVDDDWAGLPDVQAAKQRQLRRVLAIALHRVQDVVIAHAVGDAAVEVFQTIGRRRMHDAGAVVGGGVVGQVDRRQAAVAGIYVVQRVFKVQPAQIAADSGGQHRAFEAKARQAFFDQAGGQQQQAALGVDQRVLQLRVQV